MYKLVVKKSHGLHSIPLDISSSPWYFPSYAPYIVIALLFTIFLMFTLHPRGYFVTTNLYFLIPSPFSPSTNPCPLSFYFYFFKDLIYLFSERGEGRGKERERNIDVWEQHLLVVSCSPPTGDLAHSTSMCSDRDWNSELLVHRLVLNPLSHTSQGFILFYISAMVLT